MNTKAKEYNQRYYFKKAIEYLKEKGVDLNEHSIRRAMSYLSSRSNSENYKKYRAKTMDSSFMKFVNDYESEVYCNASFQ